MRTSSGPAPAPKARFFAGRTGLARLLFAIVRPGDAGAAAVSAKALRLTGFFRSAEIPLEDIEKALVEGGWPWSGVRVRHVGGAEMVSGLSRDAAEALAEALETARSRWWRAALAARGGPLHAVHERVARLADPPGYVTIGAARDLESGAREVAAAFPPHWPDALSDDPDVRMLAAIRDFLKAPGRRRKKANEAFVAAELVRSRAFFDRVERRPLTGEQRRAVVTDEDRTLVVAAAGGGKTSAIAAKAGWLLRRGYRRPSEVLILAFARDARRELEERIRGRLGGAADGVTVRTFHSLGASIIGRVEGRRPMLARSAEDEWALFDMLKGIVADLFVDGRFGGTVRRWFEDHFAPYRSEHSFRTWGEYWDYIRKYEIRSLKGERVRSFEECEIANFLYLNDIPYEYERPYEHDTATPKRRQYQPDFYLPKAGIYIEHFAISATGGTPPFMDRNEYLERMEWKRRLHAEHGTVLVETFSHERAAGRLTTNLTGKLAARGVVFSPIPPDKVFSVLERQGRIDPFIRLAAVFLRHFKGAGLSFRELARRAATIGDRSRTEAFLAVFEPIFERYEETLSRQKRIDFQDMIGKAAAHVEAGRYRSPFRHILVDEFQDISPDRARLLKALLDRAPGARLFAVGDDWQAIYRFGGSDIAIMREFGARFGAGARVDLETTFRCPDRIATVATGFVLRNPAQIRKKVRSTRPAAGPGVHVGFPAKKQASLLGEALDRIAADAAGHAGPSTVLLLGRYRRTRPPNMGALAKGRPGLRLSWSTVHRAKGLEADYAVVLGLCAGKYGFPSGTADDPVLAPVLAAPEEYPDAEERRLLYVAMTRARRQVFLLAEGGPPSPFAMELIGNDRDVAVFGRSPEADVACPTCAGGRLERRESARGGVFYGCSNWPYCEYRQPPCPACGVGLPVRADRDFRCRDCGGFVEGCPSCGGWLRDRYGRRGRFLGCSNWPACGYTRDIADRGSRSAANAASRPAAMASRSPRIRS